MKIAFDIDNTLYKIVYDSEETQKQQRVIFHQVPDYELVMVLKWFVNNGDEVYVWSAGGIDYAKSIVLKLGLENCVEVINKKTDKEIDISFDDEKVSLAKVNVQVTRVIDGQN